MPEVSDALFMFIGQDNILDTETLNQLFEKEGIKAENWEKLTDFLLWYGVIGIYDNENVKYIYNTNYDLSILKRYQKLSENNTYYQLYPTFVIDNSFFD